MKAVTHDTQITNVEAFSFLPNSCFDAVPPEISKTIYSCRYCAIALKRFSSAYVPARKMFQQLSFQSTQFVLMLITSLQSVEIEEKI